MGPLSKMVGFFFKPQFPIFKFLNTGALIVVFRFKPKVALVVDLLKFVTAIGLLTVSLWLELEDLHEESINELLVFLSFWLSELVFISRFNASGLSPQQFILVLLFDVDLSEHFSSNLSPVYYVLIYVFEFWNAFGVPSPDIFFDILLTNPINTGGFPDILSLRVPLFFSCLYFDAPLSAPFLASCHFFYFANNSFCSSF